MLDNKFLILYSENALAYIAPVKIFFFLISPRKHMLLALIKKRLAEAHLTLLLLNTSYPVLANSVDPDQLASEEANWSGSALFVIKYVSFYQTPGSSNLVGWKLEVGVAS